MSGLAWTVASVGSDFVIALCCGVWLPLRLAQKHIALRQPWNWRIAGLALLLSTVGLTRLAVMFWGLIVAADPLADTMAVYRGVVLVKDASAAVVLWYAIRIELDRDFRQEEHVEVIQHARRTLLELRDDDAD